MIGSWRSRSLLSVMGWLVNIIQSLEGLSNKRGKSILSQDCRITIPTVSSVLNCLCWSTLCHYNKMNDIITLSKEILFILVHIFWCFGPSPIGPITEGEVVLHLPSVWQREISQHTVNRRSKERSIWSTRVSFKSAPLTKWRALTTTSYLLKSSTTSTIMGKKPSPKDFWGIFHIQATVRICRNQTCQAS